MIEKKIKRREILYVRVKKENKNFLLKESKKLGYTSLSEYMDNVIESMKK